MGMGLATVLGLRRLGFFIPHRYARALPDRVPEYGALAAAFAARHDAMRDVIARLDALAPALEAIGDEPAPEPRWRQGWFPRLDAAVAYTLVRERQPGRIVEIGSGHSTRFMARAVRDGGLATRITAVDPAPRAALAGLEVDHVAATAQSASAALFDALLPGDILFVDSSHILMPGTDVDYLLNRVWPRLRRGVLVHFHDIFLPDDYPQAWAWRGYNEQLGVAPLIGSPSAHILFASHYAVTRMSADLETSVVARLPLARPAVESSLWLEKAVDPVQNGPGAE